MDDDLPKCREGALLYRELPDARDIAVYPLMFGQFQVCVSVIGSAGIDDVYYYDDASLALVAASLWDGHGEPIEGWVRHPPSGRRREGGDPAKEIIHW